MSARFEELDRRPTAMGEISLRRRWEPVLEVDVFEVRLDDEFLMSSLFTVAEIALARLGLAEVTGNGLDVLVGGLGLGYTAGAALEDSRVGRLFVVEALTAVIDWHERDLVPLDPALRDDGRCRLVEADFFAAMADAAPFGPGAPDRFHAILLDVDHSPRHHLHPCHAGFYRPEGLARVTGRLHPGGVFALWSDDPPDADFLTRLGDAFATAEAHVVAFANPYTGGESTNTVYVARRRDA